MKHDAEMIAYKIATVVSESDVRFEILKKNQITGAIYPNDR
jgi:hypothetical protein